MRSRLLAAGVFALAIGFQSTARADGIIYGVPEDGTSVLFKMTGTEVDGRDKNDVEKYAGTVAVSMVGLETIDGVKHRWVEFRHTWQNVTRGDNDDRVRIIKVLIPEKHLGKGKSPGKHVVRGWRSAYRGSAGKGKPFPVRRSDGTIYLGQPAGSFLNGPPKKSESLKPKTIETKLGKLRCKGVRGFYEDKRRNNTIKYTFTVWRNDKVPFGVVRFEMKGKEPDGDVVTMAGTIEDKQSGVTTELPKKK